MGAMDGVDELLEGSDVVSLPTPWVSSRFGDA